jgi:addiction module RelE/StbE family toxin
MNVRFSRRAQAHLDAIFTYVATENPKAARDIIRTIERLASLLAAHPDLGRPGKPHGVRVLTVPRLPYRISYKVIRGDIRILAVPHTSRRPLRTMQ